MNTRLAKALFLVCLSSPMLFAQAPARGNLAGVRRRMETRFPAAGRAGRSHTIRQIRMATCGGSALHQRNVHASRNGELLSAECYRTQDAC